MPRMRERAIPRGNRRAKRRKSAEIGMNFSCRAAIWPLTLGPLGYGDSRDVSRIKGIYLRLDLFRDHRVESARTPGGTLSHARQTLQGRAPSHGDGPA